MKGSAMLVTVIGAAMVGQALVTASYGQGENGKHRVRKGGKQNAIVHNENAQANQAAREARAAERRKKSEEAKANRAGAKANGEATRKALELKGKDRVDQRQENQAQRIQHGINKGHLTADEVTKLQTQQQNIADLEASALSDGKLTRDEFKSIRTELNAASRCIWGEKHDTGGNQMPTYRLGKNVFAKDSFTSQMANENLSPDEAKVLLKDFRRATELKRTLSTGNLSDAERATMQTEYDTLLNKYFDVR